MHVSDALEVQLSTSRHAAAWFGECGAQSPVSDPDHGILQDSKRVTRAWRKRKPCRSPQALDARLIEHDALQKVA
jgi:hypothetical protein